MDSNHLGDELPRLVDRMVASYRSDPRTQYIDGEYLPSRRVIVEICDLLLELTYPGYIGRRGLTSHNISFHVGELLPRLWEHLAGEITQCLCHASEAECGCSGRAPARPSGAAGHPPAEQELGRYPSSRPAMDRKVADCHERACDLASRFVRRIPDVRAMLADDVQAAYDGDPAASGTAEVILAYPAILAITIYRYAHELYGMDVPLMPRIMTEHAHYLTGIDIHPGARIGRSFFIDHGTGVVVGETTEIGDNVKIYQGVTLGALSFPKDERGRIIRGYKRHPTVGHGVTIYANAIVLGGETRLGDGSIVGGSVFLTRSVEPGHQVSITPPVLRVRPPTPAGPEAHPETADAT